MTYESVQPFLHWIQEHPHLAGFAVFIISLSESLAVVGLLVPGVVMMTAIGAMMGAGVLPFWGTLIWAILGAIAGDGISYWLGHHYHEHLRDFWPFNKFPVLLKRGEKFFENHGGKSIIFGRFVGPVRPMIPVIAGMMDMPPRRFLIFNILSAIAWAPLYSLPGILIGVSLGTLSPEVARRIVLLILIILLILWILYVLLLKIGVWIGNIISNILAKWWRNWQQSNRLPWLHKILATAQGTEEGQLGTALLFIIFGTAFIAIAYNVYEGIGIAKWNEPVYQLLRPLYNDQVVNWATLITGLGQASILLPVAAVVGLWLLWKKRYIAMFCWLGTIGAGEATGYLLRSIVAMPRPEGLVKLSHEFSFPSGHCLTATLVYGLAAAFIQHAVAKNHRWIPWAICIPLILIICISRVYLGAHWFTDILGGVTLGAAFVSLGILIFRRIEHKIPPLTDILIPGLIMLCIMMTFYTIKVYPKTRLDMVRQWTTNELDVNDWWKDQKNGYEFYRSGAIKRVATYFDIQWLGNMDAIRKLLEQHGWEPLHELNLQSTLTFLSDTVPPLTMPVLPRFHRDRLPVLVMGKSLDNTDRLVLQLWNSDFVGNDGRTLWVGTLRIESLSHPLPLVSIYLESEFQDDIVNQFKNEMRKYPNIMIESRPTSSPNLKQILLIKGK